MQGHELFSYPNPPPPTPNLGHISSPIEWIGVNGWIILRWISRRWDVGIWTGLGWLKIGTGGVRLWVRWWTFGFREMRGISWLAASQSAAQEGLCTVEWVSNYWMNKGRYSSWLSWLKRKAGNSPLSSAVIRKAWSCVLLHTQNIWNKMLMDTIIQPSIL